MHKIIMTALPRLMNQHPFYAHLFQKVVKIDEPTLPAPMGVSFKDGKIHLYYNSKMCEDMKLNPFMISDILHHELLHVVNGHVFQKKQRGHLWNVCQDLEINKHLPETAEKIGVTVKKANEQFKLKMEEGKLAAYYHGHLYQNSDDGEGMGTIDDHSKFDESDDSEVSKQELSQTIRESFESFKKYGNVSQSLMEELNAHLKSKVNWKRQLRNMVASALNVTRKKTRSKVNRRLGYQLQGTKKDDIFKIAFCVDTSGSMSTESLSQCWAELVAIHKNMNCDITVIEADCEVQNVYEFSRKSPPKFSGRGGTSYVKSVDKAKEFNPDIILYFTDLDCADVPKDPKIPFLWIGVGNQQPPANFGRVIRIDV